MVLVGVAIGFGQERPAFEVVSLNSSSTTIRKPRTLSANFEFNVGGKKKMLQFEVRHWITNGEAGIGEDQVSGSSTGVGNMIYGAKGYLSTAKPGFKIFLGKSTNGPEPSADRQGDNWAKFIQAVRSRKYSDLNAPIEEGMPSVILIHLANISYRLGRTLNSDRETRFGEPSPAPEQTIGLTRRRVSGRHTSAYLPSQLTLLFQSTNAPLGLSRHAQTCSSKWAGKPYRLGLGTNWNDCPSSTGGLV